MSTEESQSGNSNFEELDAKAIDNFVEYLQIPSVHPNVNYDACVAFIKRRAEDLDLPLRIHYCYPKKPIIILSWCGLEPDLPAILLSSHMDVVPVFEEKWKHKPFSAYITDEGDIYARGAQDMKCVGIQYLEAIKRMRQNGVSLRRTIHILFTPDEEISGVEGMREFVKTETFQFLNVGFALDEGMSSPTDDFVLFYGERCIWYMIIHCTGESGHGSLLLKSTAGQKLQYVLRKFYEFRDQQEEKLRSDPSLTVGDVISVNLTQIQGGVQPNVVPPEFTIVIDCRIPVTVDVAKWEQTINKWCKEAGDGVWIEYKQKLPQVPVTRIDNSNPFWIAFKKTSDKLNIGITPRVFPGGTDSRYLRGVGIPALGFSPINNTPVLLHEHNEYLNRNVFLRGIQIYYEIIAAVANVADVTG